MTCPTDLFDASSGSAKREIKILEVPLHEFILKFVN
jgi:hypothetical protein